MNPWIYVTHPYTLFPPKHSPLLLVYILSNLEQIVETIWEMQNDSDLQSPSHQCFEVTKEAQVH